MENLDEEKRTQINDFSPEINARAIDTRGSI